METKISHFGVADGIKSIIFWLISSLEQMSMQAIKIVFILFGLLLAVSAYENYTEPAMAEIVAEWIHPEDEEFMHSNIRHAYERDGPCTCPSVFAPNTYTGDQFPSEVIAGIEYAQCLWSCVLSDITPGVKVRVNNVQKSGNVLASAGPRFTTSTSDRMEYVPCALRGGTCSVAIEMYIDPDAVPYYFGTDGMVPYRQYDFVTVVLHELGHGLGFSGYINAASGGYLLGAPRFIAMDRRIRYLGQFPWSTNPPTSTLTASQAVVSKNLFFQGTSLSGKLFAPTVPNPGSSVYHFDEATYPAGDPDSLMTPSVRNGEANHSPGRLVCDLLVTIGYPIPDLSVCGLPPSGYVPPASSSPTRTQSPSRSSTPIASVEVQPSVSSSATPSRSQSRTPSATGTSPGSGTPSVTGTPLGSSTATASETRVTFSRTPSATKTPSRSSSETRITFSRTPSATKTPSPLASQSQATCPPCVCP
jgi:hypothetical protein